MKEFKKKVFLKIIIIINGSQSKRTKQIMNILYLFFWKEVYCGRTEWWLMSAITSLHASITIKNKKIRT